MISDVEVREAGPKGKGVFALRSFGAGEFIFRRKHRRVLGRAEIPSLSAVEVEHLTQLGPDRFAIVLPPGAFLNHSCEPNALRSGVNVHAWRDIARDEEITIDYRLNALAGDSWPCRCGSSNCRGHVEGSFFEMDEATQRALLPYAGNHVMKEYTRRRKDC